MLGFYEDMAEFAAMSESEGFLGQCASEVADPPPADPLLMESQRGAVVHCHILIPDRPRQLQLLVIEKSAMAVTKAG
jgi:hypothetical protein